MSTKFIRFVTALAIMVIIVGNTGVALANYDAAPSVGAQNVPQPLPLDLPSLLIAPATSLGVQFVHVVTAANRDPLNLYATIIDHPLTNGNPSAIIIVTPNYDPGEACACQYSNHPIGLWYDPGSGGTWRIFNEDIVDMTVGTTFNVIIPTAGAGVFVHEATVGNITAATTAFDNALTNDNPNAIVLATQNYNPGGASPTLNNRNTGVFYNETISKWAIFNQDNAAMPLSASFNVFILPTNVGVFVHTPTAANISGHITTMDNPLTNDNPNAIVFVTPNYNPGGGLSGTYDDHPIGVYYIGGRWKIFNQDIAAMPPGADFNVLVLVPVSDVFVHTATVANSVGGATSIDNALTNSHPNAIAFTTPNWNPGGVGGVYNNHNIGVYYYSLPNQWTVFNQDIVPPLVNAAFNVLIPNPDTSVFVHKATAGNIAASGFAHATVIDYPLVNGKPNAILIVTPNYNPGDVGGTYDNHPIGVWYSGGTWRIFNEDIAAMPANASFNVFVPTASAGVDVFVHTATVGNSFSDYTIIDNPLANDNPNAIVLVTPNYDPGGVCPCEFSNYRLGVWYTGSRWAIFNQDGVSAIPVDTSFNVYVDANYKNYLPLILR